jgi:hypothetical protein
VKAMARAQPSVGVALAAVVFLWSWEIVGRTG